MVAKGSDQTPRVVVHADLGCASISARLIRKIFNGLSVHWAKLTYKIKARAKYNKLRGC